MFPMLSPSRWNIQGTTIIGASFLPPQMSGGRERLSLSFLGSIGEEDLGSVSLALVHDARVLELLDQSLFASVSDISMSVRN